jgi:hypothetical protein
MPLRLNPVTGELFIQGLDYVDFDRPPTAADNTYEPPFGWLDTTLNEWYVCVALSSTGVATWKAAGGDVTGPASSTDNAIARFDGTTGKLLQDSTAILDDAGALSGLTTVTADDLILTNPLAVAYGGTGAATLTDGGILLGSGTGAVTALGQAVDGQLPIGSTGLDPVLGTLTAGVGISIANGAGSISISSTGGGFTWNEETGTSATMVVDNGYIANNASLVTLTLPAAATVGQEVRVAGKGAGLFRIAQNAGQTVHYVSSDTTTGAGGSLTAIEQYASIELVCITANTDWIAISSTGNFTIV